MFWLHKHQWFYIIQTCLRNSLKGCRYCLFWGVVEVIVYRMLLVLLELVWGKIWFMSDSRINWLLGIRKLRKLGSGKLLIGFYWISLLWRCRLLICTESDLNVLLLQYSKAFMYLVLARNVYKMLYNLLQCSNEFIYV